MNDTPDSDHFLKIGRLNVGVGSVLIVVGVMLMLMGKPKDETTGGFISQQIGVAFLTTGAIDLLVFTGLAKLKEYLSRDARELQRQLRETESRLEKEAEAAARRADLLLAQVDDFRKSIRLDLLHADIGDIKSESADHTRRLEQIQEDLERVRLAVDQEFRETLNGPQGDLLRRSRKLLRTTVGHATHDPKP